MEEGQAVALLKNGSSDGLETLVHLYYFQAVRASYLIVQDSELAEDIVQAAFLRANEKIHQLRSERFAPWFMRIVIRDSIKASNRQKRFVSLDGGEEEHLHSIVEWLTDKRPSLEEMVVTEELRRDVWKALTLLTARQRAVIVLKYYFGLSEAEITRELDAPLSTIKWQLFTARQKFKKLFKTLNSFSESRGSESVHRVSEEAKEERHE